MVSRFFHRKHLPAAPQETPMEAHKRALVAIAQRIPYEAMPDFWAHVALAQAISRSLVIDLYTHGEAHELVIELDHLSDSPVCQPWEECRLSLAEWAKRYPDILSFEEPQYGDDDDGGDAA